MNRRIITSTKGKWQMKKENLIRKYQRLLMEETKKKKDKTV